MIQGIAAIDSEVRDKNSVRDYGSEFKKLEHRRDSDPMKLYSYVLKKLDDYFSIRGLTYLPGQRDLLAKAAETILQAVSGTVTAIPFQPGLGKTTLIYDLLRIFSHEFLKNTPIAKEIGGVIVVVEKTSEAKSLNSFVTSAVLTRILQNPSPHPTITIRSKADVQMVQLPPMRNVLWFSQPAKPAIHRSRLCSMPDTNGTRKI